MSIEIKIVKANLLAVLPTKATSDCAGSDLHSCEAGEILPGKILILSTGLKVEIPEGYEWQIRPRSGLAFNHGISIVNAPGTIDSDYRGIVKVALVNLGEKPYSINVGDRVCQAVLNKVPLSNFIEVKKLGDTKRGSGGFGSTGT